MITLVANDIKDVFLWGIELSASERSDRVVREGSGKQEVSHNTRKKAEPLLIEQRNEQYTADVELSFQLMG